MWGFFSGWQAALDSEGARDMVHLRRLFEAYPWHSLVPEQFSHKPWYELVFAEEERVVVDGFGEQRGLDFLAAANTADRSLLFAYMPTARTVTVDLSRLSGERKKCWWFNPRTGQSQLSGEAPGQGLYTLTPPAEGDWVLVLADAERNPPIATL